MILTGSDLYENVGSGLEVGWSLLSVKPLMERTKADMLKDKLEALLVVGGAVGHQQEDVRVGDSAQVGQLLVQQAGVGPVDLLAHGDPGQVPQLGGHGGGGGQEEGGEVPHGAQLGVGDGGHPGAGGGAGGGLLLLALSSSFPLSRLGKSFQKAAHTASS